MARDDEQKAQIRDLRGVNVAEDARIAEPGAFWVTKNYYGRQRKSIATRPGSSIVAYQHQYLTTLDTKYGAGFWGAGQTLTGFTHTSWSRILDNVVSQSALQSLRPTTPVISPISQIQTLNTNVTVASGLTINQFPIGYPTGTIGPGGSALTGAMRIAGLVRLSSDEGATNYLIGALNHGKPFPDHLFYIADSSTLITTIPIPNNICTTSGAEWYFLPFRYFAPNNTDVAINQSNGIDPYGYHCIITNTVDRPMTVNVSSIYSPPAVTALDITTSESALSGYKLVACQAMCVYGGSIVYGGYKMFKDSTGSVRHFDNFIAFADPGAPTTLSSDSSNTYNVQVGDSVSERVTAIVPNSIQTDTQGTQSQLVVFTTKRVKIYSGFPPVSNTTGGTNFVSTALGDVGCISPRTVCQTPYGVMYLGTDGYIYLIPQNGRPIKVSRAIENVLAGMSQRRLKLACAVFRNDWYILSFSSGKVADQIKPSITFGHLDRNTTTLRNDYQYWADMRWMNGNMHEDLGIRWWGPMQGQQIGCFALANGPEDNNDIYGGWDHMAAVSKLWQPQLTSDPNLSDPSTTSPITNQLIFGEIDMGDPHVDKEIIAVRCGVTTNAATDVTIRLVNISDVGLSMQGEQQTFPVTPPGALWGSFNWGSGNWSDQLGYKMISLRPARPSRGRMFRIEIKAVASGSTIPAVTFQDFEINFRPVPRQD